MKNAILICLLVVGNHMGAAKKVDLQSAIKSGLVNATFRSTGSFQGYCMLLSVISNCSDSLAVYVAAGTRLDSKNNTEQDIVVTEPLLASISPRGRYSGKLKGYCCQASNRAPVKDAKYELYNRVDSALIKMAIYLSRRKFERDVEQSAIWAISDKCSVANLPDTSEELVSLRHVAAALSGQKIPWYSTSSFVSVGSNRQMSRLTTSVSGTLNFDNDKARYVTFQVIDESGMAVCKIVSQWLLPGQSLQYPFIVPVAGLNKGKYTVMLQAPETTLARKTFEL